MRRALAASRRTLAWASGPLRWLAEVDASHAAGKAVAARGTRLVNSRLLATGPRTGLVSAGVAAAFVGLRVIVAGHGHVGALVVAGSDYVSPSRYTRGIPITAGSGYDGQFYYRTALSPWTWSRQAFGIRFDTLGRLDRVAYPALVWLASAGQHVATPAMMALVNVAALGLLAGCGSVLARECGRHPLWGLLLAGFFGLLWSLSRDLTELTEAAFLVGALAAMRARKPVLAGAALGVAVLAREPALLIAGAVLLARLFSIVPHGREGSEGGAARGGRAAGAPGGTAVGDEALGGRAAGARGGTARGGTARGGWPSWDDASWAIPVVAFATWQIALRVGTGTFPLFTSSQNNAGVPLVGLAHGLAHYAERFPSVSSLLWFGELAVLLLVGALAAFTLGQSTATLYEKVAWAAACLLAISLTSGIWLGDVGFRSLDDFYLLSIVLLLSSRVRLDAVGLCVGSAWVVVAVELVRFI